MSLSSSPPRADVVVLLGTAWSSLERHVTRWRAVIQQWATDERIASVRVVDFPSMSVRNLTRPRAAVLDSWDPRVRAVTGRIAVWRHRTPLDALAWRATGRALGAALPPAGQRRIVIAATPLWAPVLKYLPAERRGFDAVDDWRALPSVARVRDHVKAGYRAAAKADAATAVSSALADRLSRDFEVAASTVANGVDLNRFLGPAPPPPAGVPAEDFAVYVGVIQERVDLELLRAARKVMPVVVAGPAPPATVTLLTDSKIIYLGALPEATVTALLRSATVGLVPHHVDALTTSMDPMKLREYLAAGLPVATTVDSPAAAGTARVIVAQGARQFADAVEQAQALGPLHAPDPGVAHRTWATVADELFVEHAGLSMKAESSR